MFLYDWGFCHGVNLRIKMLNKVMMIKDVSSRREETAAAVSQVSRRILFQIYTDTICIAAPPVRVGTVKAV